MNTSQAPKAPAPSRRPAVCFLEIQPWNYIPTHRITTAFISRAQCKKYWRLFLLTSPLDEHEDRHRRKRCSRLSVNVAGLIQVQRGGWEKKKSILAKRSHSSKTRMQKKRQVNKEVERIRNSSRKLVTVPSAPKGQS